MTCQMPEPPNKDIVLLTFNLFDTVYWLARGSGIFVTVIFKYHQYRHRRHH